MLIGVKILMIGIPPQGCIFSIWFILVVQEAKQCIINFYWSWTSGSDHYHHKDCVSLKSYKGVHLTNPSKLCCDNKSAIYIISNHTFHEKTKHIDMDCHYVRKEFLRKDIDLFFVPFKYQLRDFFTPKPLLPIGFFS